MNLKCMCELLLELYIINMIRYENEKSLIKCKIIFEQKCEINAKKANNHFDGLN